MKKEHLILLCIFIVALFLRFYKLGEVPGTLHRDEAFLGYNAYSILNTSSDMSGTILPLHLESFIYSPAGYSYFSIPFISLSGLTEFSVRFASAFFGSLTVLATYFLVQELFKKEKNRKQSIGQLSLLSLFSSFFIAISPWHVNLSRTATENSIAVFFITMGVLVFIVGSKKKSILFLCLSYIFFFTSLFIYQAPRVFLIFFIPLLILSFLRLLHFNRKMLIGILLCYIFFIAVPVFLIFSSKALSLRIKTVSIFATSETQLVIDEKLREDGVVGENMLASRIFHNKIIGYSQAFLQNYFNHFSYNFLFTDQAFPDRYRIPTRGLLYLFELPLLALGTIFILRLQSHIAILLLGWIFLTPIGSAFTFDDVPNLQRTLIFFPALSIVTASGMIQVIIFFKKTNKILLFFTCSVIILFSIFSYLHAYYTHAQFYKPWFRNDGYKLLVQKVNSLSQTYKKVIVTTYESAPTIFFLFYTQYNPLKFQEETKNSSLRDFDRVGFSKFMFSQEACPLRAELKDNKEVLIGDKDVLYVNSGTCKLFSGVKIISEIKRKDNSVVFRIVSL